MERQLSPKVLCASAIPQVSMLGRVQRAGHNTEVSRRRTSLHNNALTIGEGESQKEHLGKAIITGNF